MHSQQKKLSAMACIIAPYSCWALSIYVIPPACLSIFWESGTGNAPQMTMIMIATSIIIVMKRELL